MYIYICVRERERESESGATPSKRGGKTIIGVFGRAQSAIRRAGGVGGENKSSYKYEDGRDGGHTKKEKKNV